MVVRHFLLIFLGFRIYLVWVFLLLLLFFFFFFHVSVSVVCSSSCKVVFFF